MPPAISAPRGARSTQFGELLGEAHIRTLSSANFMTLDQHFQGQMTSSLHNFAIFLVKRARHRFSWPSTQTKTDSFNPQKAEEAQSNGLS